MNNDNKIGTLPSQRTKKFTSKIKALIFVLEVSFILALLVVWLSSDSIQKSKNLWVLFLYSFPAEFLIAIVPHEPVLLYFGRFYSPLTVALVAIAGTLLTEALNYSVFKFVTDTSLFMKIRHRKAVNKVLELFKKAPFIALLVAGLTPVPFYPFRFLVVVARYPLIKYLLALFLSRTPRFFILSLIGYTIKIPDYLLIALFIILIISVNIPFLRRFLEKRQMSREHAS